jgi:hypothetical protein
MLLLYSSSEEESGNFRNVVRVYCGVRIFKTMEKFVLHASDALHVSSTFICLVQCSVLYVNVVHKRIMCW